MTWNYRVLAHEIGGELYFKLHEVYYKDNIPKSYTSDSATFSSETSDGLGLMMNKMQEALQKPILWAGAKFPNIFEEAK